MQKFCVSTFVPKLPKDVLNILDTLHNAGYEAYIVGGCVRDMILCEIEGSNIYPSDYDIATSAEPNEVSRLFNHCIPTGLKHGTITVLLQSQSYEITTFRIDGTYSNSRSPDNVYFSKSLFDDLNRRDFSINALAYAPDTGLIDKVGGVADILNKRIVCVGDSFIRFREDSLRILRAMRFASTLGFEIESRTKDAMFALSVNLLSIARERIRVELSKLLCGLYAKEVLDEFLHIIRIIVPQIPAKYSFYYFKNLSKRTICIAWACFLYPCLNVDSILSSLRFDNKTKSYILTLLQVCKISFDMNALEIKHLMVRFGGRDDGSLLNAECIIKDVLIIKDAMGEDKCVLQNFENLFYQILKSNVPLSLKELCLDGDAIVDIGFKGKKVGKVLRLLLIEVLEGKMPNTKHALLNKAQSFLESSH